MGRHIFVLVYKQVMFISVSFSFSFSTNSILYTWFSQFVSGVQNYRTQTKHILCILWFVCKIFTFIMDILYVLEVHWGFTSTWPHTQRKKSAPSLPFPSPPPKEHIPTEVWTSQFINTCDGHIALQWYIRMKISSVSHLLQCNKLHSNTSNAKLRTLLSQCK